jgi:hypothetical protein
VHVHRTHFALGWNEKSQSLLRKSWKLKWGILISRCKCPPWKYYFFYVLSLFLFPEEMTSVYFVGREGSSEAAGNIKQMSLCMGLGEKGSITAPCIVLNYSSLPFLNHVFSLTCESSRVWNSITYIRIFLWYSTLEYFGT